MIGWYVFTYPLLADRINRLYNLNSISSYNSLLSQYSDKSLTEMLQNCIEYNTTVANEQSKQAFHYRGSTATDKLYQSVPIPNSDIIGSVEIPKLNLDVAIVHGTSDDNLQNNIGHLYGTSLPVEGKAVHSVIAGHSALSTAELFTHINRLKKGDVFYIDILNKRYKYTVQSKTVCLPEDDWQYEQINPETNMVTLYTCTPYGINDHRLLVTGQLTKISKIKRGKPFTLQMIGKTILFAFESAVLIFAPVAMLVLWWNSDKNLTHRKEENI